MADFRSSKYFPINVEKLHWTPKNFLLGWTTFVKGTLGWILLHQLTSYRQVPIIDNDRLKFILPLIFYLDFWHKLLLCFYIFCRIPFFQYYCKSFEASGDKYEAKDIQHAFERFAGELMTAVDISRLILSVTLIPISYHLSGEFVVSQLVILILVMIGSEFTRQKIEVVTKERQWALQFTEIRKFMPNDAHGRMAHLWNYLIYVRRSNKTILVMPRVQHACVVSNSLLRVCMKDHELQERVNNETELPMWIHTALTKYH